jgi:hypothetical protein
MLHIRYPYHLIKTKGRLQKDEEKPLHYGTEWVEFLQNNMYVRNSVMNINIVALTGKLS